MNIQIKWQIEIDLLRKALPKANYTLKGKILVRQKVLLFLLRYYNNEFNKRRALRDSGKLNNTYLSINRKPYEIASIESLIKKQLNIVEPGKSPRPGSVLARHIVGHKSYKDHEPMKEEDWPAEPIHAKRSDYFQFNHKLDSGDIIKISIIIIIILLFALSAVAAVFILPS